MDEVFDRHTNVRTGAVATTLLFALRNAQQQVALHQPNTGIVVTQDLGNDTNLHPPRRYAVADGGVCGLRSLSGLPASSFELTIPEKR